ncbi:sugar transferase [Paradevosia shaoguanensis]|jgi:Undecaprenyl-phosphate galactose phosphotransferase WbaP|uniref:Sugar transferase n=1 Tax=Paradevosia shaoguanensis TaxID=1335043 RepID=A0AA41QRA7_9HYPH|nr:sugar transferase [Paradevosia shaoguanensis]KFL24972.1 exopolysaccharide biosynthesis protein [Devosia sp. 17-2-E-8]MBI4046118.1 sugar transferase [Devosia nanyangense]QMV00382.1 sugar transferase [Devosia sp. D6-9]CDP53703.1 Undecaprenyl-phosphate galactosephosphotransferase [Devosia sp. DBB001]MCF1744777.1 sugar transferase [Paradevosia shaoguanensis]
MSIINAEMGSSSTPSNAGIPRGGTAKRAFDIVAASAMLVFALPAMFFIAVFLFSTDRGPIVFSHERVGHNGRRFRCLKFRSMVVDSQEALRRHLEASPQARAEWEASQKLTDDPRITPIGRFLRATSLDELPQLINVIRGDMSLVGPRPIVEDEVARYAEEIQHYAAVRPGITGLWQVSGRSDVDYDQRVQLDTRYVREWSFAGDIVILVKTVKVVLLRTGSR